MLIVGASEMMKVVVSGSAYIYYNNSGIWQQQTKLTASDGDEIDDFGVC